MEDLDRRSLSLYNEVAAIKRSLQHLTTQCSSQHLEMELRRAATNILGPIMGSVHDQSRLELERMRNHVSAASSRAEAAYSLAYSARAEVQACQAQQSVPDVRGILQELNVQGGGGGEHADSGESNRRRSPSRGGVDKQQQSREAMWERIDNHLACHELRLRKSTDQFVRAAINRALIEVEADQGPGENSGGGTRNSTGGRRRTGGILSQDETKASGERIHVEGSQTTTTSDYILLKRNIDDEILMLAKYKRELKMENKRDMELWKEATKHEMLQVIEQKMLQATEQASKKKKETVAIISTSATTTSQEAGVDEERMVRERLGPILRSIQEQLDKMQNDFILHKLHTSTRFGQLEDEVRKMQEEKMMEKREQRKRTDDGAGGVAGGGLPGHRGNRAGPPLGPQRRAAGRPRPR